VSVPWTICRQPHRQKDSGGPKGVDEAAKLR
jgi:hypothetical protein